MPALLMSFKFWKYFGIGIAVILLMYGINNAVNNWKSSIVDNERLNAKSAQYDQMLIDQEALKSRTQELEQLNSDILLNADSKNTTIVERHTEVKEYINTPEAQSSNRESSDIIKNTIRMLKDEEL